MARGHVTKFGYRRVQRPGTRKQAMEHVLVWERHHGPVPAGKELHHINGDKLDNRIGNLQLVTRLQHKRIHSGCRWRDGVWWKRCRRCGVWKPATEYYEYPGSKGLAGTCKPCAIRLAVEQKRRRRHRRRIRAIAITLFALGMLPPVAGDAGEEAESTPAPSATGVEGTRT